MSCRHPNRLGALLALALIGLCACQPAASGSSGVSATPTSTPTQTPLPIAMPRPTDIPTDGSCEANVECLGLIAPGKVYRTRAFVPGLSFSIPSGGWENRSDELYVFQLLRIAAPGDAIAFFQGAHAVNPADGSAANVAATVPAIAAWIRSDPLLVTTAPKAVVIGGLSGVSIDIAIVSGATNSAGDCPVQACVPLLRGDDLKALPPWHWDWGSGGPERQRLYLLRAPQTIVAIFVDSFDGTTFDALTAAALPILRSVKFS